ncbi:hypothetical protein [Pelagibacterium luteolum]|uniref:Uncharacterized protein n=1 Tax=Pelagibacterium luteolum TaxID=440168 RepID=A0A1G7ZIG9_9HYPH|nr:hypothetical protein [Pelagibacterium luteolum]SDH07880.1 hypothetical protein SAMN04487974_1207 [Pelagibacterium luteolum]
MDQDTLAETFLDQAEWRERKAAEFPDDERNTAAAKHLRALAATANEVDQTLLTAAEELFEDAPDIEVWTEMLRQEGFASEHSSAAEFVKAFISKRSSGH